MRRGGVVGRWCVRGSLPGDAMCREGTPSPPTSRPAPSVPSDPNQPARSTLAVTTSASPQGVSTPSSSGEVTGSTLKRTVEHQAPNSGASAPGSRPQPWSSELDMVSRSDAGAEAPSDASLGPANCEPALRASACRECSCCREHSSCPTHTGTRVLPVFRWGRRTRNWCAA